MDEERHGKARTFNMGMRSGFGTAYPSVCGRSFVRNSTEDLHRVPCDMTLP